MRFFGFLALLLPLIEIAVMVMVGQEIGVLGVIGLLILGVVTGVFLLRQQGLETMRRMRNIFDRGEVPVVEMWHGVLLAMAGILFILPGFVSDVIALFLLIPAFRRRIAARSQGFVHVSGMRARRSGPIIDAEEWVVEEENPYGQPQNSRRLAPRNEASPPWEKP